MRKYMLMILVGWMVCAGGAGAVDLGDVAIHGFISQGYLQSDKYNYLSVRTDEGSFETNEMGLNFTSQLTDDLRVGAQLFAMDIGEYGNDEITVDWAYGDYRLHNMLGFRAGKFKIAHGLYNETRDIDAVRTYVFLPRAIYDPSTRDTFAGMKGVNLYGELPLGFSYHASYGMVPPDKKGKISKDLAEYAEYEVRDSIGVAVRNVVIAQTTAAYIAAGFPPAQAAAMAETAASITAAEYVGNTSIVTGIEDMRSKNGKNFALRWSPPFLNGLRLSTTYFGSEVELDLNLNVDQPALPGRADPPAQTIPVKIKLDEVSSWVYSLEYTFSNLVLFGEYDRIKVDTRDAPTIDIEGWSAGASYRFSYWFELGGYYSDYCTDIDDRGGEKLKKRGEPAAVRWLRDACLSARFDVNDYWLFKLEGHVMRGLDEVDWKVSTPAGETPDEGWYLFAAKVTYNF